MEPKTMTIVDAQRLKASLEGQIMRLVSEYEYLTGTQVTDIELTRFPIQEMGSYTRTWQLQSARVRVELR